MDGQNDQGYGMPEDVRFDDLINNAGWPASADQQYHQYQQPQPNPYSQFQPNLSYEHFDPSQQVSYPPVSYANSPYTTQYQHARPSDVFGPSSYNVDPSLQGSPAYHAPESSFSFAPAAIESATISPESLQYRMPSNQPTSRSVSNASFQQAANAVGIIMAREPKTSPTYITLAYKMEAIKATPSHNPVLPNGTLENESKPAMKKYVDTDAAANAPRTQQGKSASSQSTLRMLYPELYASKNPSSRPRFDYAPFLSWEDQPLQITLGLKSTPSSRLLRFSHCIDI